ncbi:MAG TPA: hypothetical protein VLL76_08340, partial [Candidatus Omnitrophota bacterium]|nr:hypothetical protein [Candidatus Omnitrophota bacterium]
LLKGIATSPAQPIDQRLAAAERAEAMGLMDAELVRKLYGEIEFSVEEMSGVMARADAGPRVRALLYRVAWNMADQGVKGQIVAKALDLAAAKGELASTARIFAPLLGDIRPSPEQAGIAAVAAKAQYAIGRGEAADKWLDIARAGPDAQAAARLWPYAAIHAAGGQQPIALPSYAGWRATQDNVPPELRARRAALVLGVLSGLGADVPDAAWLDAVEVPAGGTKPGLFALMQGGALDARIGITVLAALAAIGDTPLAKADPLTLSEAISALSVVGLTEDARALAVEILLANGV